MPSTSASFTFTGAPGSLQKKSCSVGGTVVATLDDIAGVTLVQWTIESTDETTTAGNFTLTLSGAKNSICTVSGAGFAEGKAAILKCTVNSGVDPQTGSPSERMSARAKFFVPTSAGLEVGCFGEGDESSAEFWWIGLLNAAVRYAALGPPGPQGPPGPAGSPSDDTFRSALAYFEAAAPSTEIFQSEPDPTEEIVMTATITPYEWGRLIISMTLLGSGSDASAIVRVRISGGAYTNDLVFATSLDALVSVPCSTTHARPVESDTEYTVNVTVEVTGIGFFQVLSGSSLLLREAPLAS